MEYALPALGIFAGGVVLGAAVALLVAPKPGQELREDIARRIPFGSNGDPTTKSVTSGSSTSGATTTSGSRSSA
ncbi:MAG: YtxH domain-containing protein [Deltaproteobacteria bacterium]|nr:YtxH domain-containing protein [Deltaproteobacteria bacterium]MCB9786163.1 YtxH domain-containing protein [Deltaproteobacteria bacterium]